MQGRDPTKPESPAFVKPLPKLDLAAKRKKPLPTGGLMNHPVLYARLGPEKK